MVGKVKDYILSLENSSGSGISFLEDIPDFVGGVMLDTNTTEVQTLTSYTSSEAVSCAVTRPKMVTVMAGMRKWIDSNPDVAAYFGGTLLKEGFKEFLANYRSVAKLLLNFNFVPTNGGTLAVGFDSQSGRYNLYHNDDFLTKISLTGVLYDYFTGVLDKEELSALSTYTRGAVFLLFHEVMHVVKGHMNHTVGDVEVTELMNIVADSEINTELLAILGRKKYPAVLREVGIGRAIFIANTFERDKLLDDSFDDRLTDSAKTVMGDIRLVVDNLTTKASWSSVQYLVLNGYKYINKYSTKVVIGILEEVQRSCSFKPLRFRKNVESPMGLKDALSDIVRNGGVSGVSDKVKSNYEAGDLVVYRSKPLDSSKRGVLCEVIDPYIDMSSGEAKIVVSYVGKDGGNVRVRPQNTYAYVDTELTVYSIVKLNFVSGDYMVFRVGSNEYSVVAVSELKEMYALRDDGEDGVDFRDVDYGNALNVSQVDILEVVHKVEGSGVPLVGDAVWFTDIEGYRATGFVEAAYPEVNIYEVKTAGQLVSVLGINELESVVDLYRPGSLFTIRNTNKTGVVKSCSRKGEVVLEEVDNEVLTRYMSGEIDKEKMLSLSGAKIGV